MNPISWSLQESKSNLKTNPALEFNRGSRFPGFQSGFEWPSSVMNLNLYTHIIIYRYMCVCMYVCIYIYYYYYYIQPTTKKKQLCLWYRFQPVWGTARRRWWLPRNGLVSPSHLSSLRQTQWYFTNMIQDGNLQSPFAVNILRFVPRRVVPVFEDAPNHPRDPCNWLESFDYS